MKRTTKILAALLLVCIALTSFISCKDEGPEFVDYVSSLKLDMNSDSLKQEVTVKQYVDGDTTHFYVPNSVSTTGVLKARYLSINTPESTGKIEEWGKKASNFTKTKLKGASSIIIESDDGKWNADSTGERYLVWVWYRNSESEDYRNLNLEILQEGLAIASNSSQNRYGKLCVDAIAQAKTFKLNVHSKAQDPDFFYGEAQPLDLNELRINIKNYDGSKVSFNATVVRYYNNGVFVEAYDEETGMYNGMYLYYGFTLSSEGEEMLVPGNELKIVGTVSYYEAGDSYQVSDLQYRTREPDDPSNLQIISTGNEVPYTELTAETFLSKVKVEVIEDGEEVIKEFDYANLALGTSVSMKNLVVTDVYTTDNEESSSKGAMTLTCKVGDLTIDVRTLVFKDTDGDVITEDYFMGKTLDVKGVVDCFNGTYQIKVFSLNDITIK